ncbi:MAG: helix-turn-helix transcriptional regulator [Candidatus Saccharimonadales bacterium]
MSSDAKPYVKLGMRLKALRTLRKATAAEVSGAVEIEETSLASFEKGVERPSEDILMLLINYFGMQDDDAAVMWQLAGYDAPKNDDDDSDDEDNDREQFIKDAMKNGHTAIMMMAFDPRVMYSDGVDISVNRQGMVLNFTQGNMQGGRMPVSRIGVSFEQAQGLLEVLQRSLKEAKTKQAPRQLPSSGSDQADITPGPDKKN